MSRKAEELSRRSVAEHVEAHLIDSKAAPQLPDTAPAHITAVVASLRAQSKSDMRRSQTLRKGLPQLRRDAEASMTAASARELHARGTAELEQLMRGKACCQSGLAAAEELSELMHESQRLHRQVRPQPCRQPRLASV